MKRTTRIIILIIILILIFGGVLYFAVSNNYIFGTGKTVEEEIHYYTYTQAVCDENNFCQDYVIKCENDKETSRTAISGAAIQHLDGWEDTRDKNTVNNFCNISK